MSIHPPVAAAPNTVEPATTTTPRRILRFTRHFLVMLAAMYLGMLALGPVYVWAARSAGYTDPWTQLPALSAMVMAFTMTVPMAAWMRWHGHGWRPVGEMTAAMFVPAGLAAVMYLAGAASAEAVMGIGHMAMIPAMLAVMLYRYREYAT